jgi:uncharacterized integral membrane protein
MSKIKTIASNVLLALFVIVIFLFAIFLLQNTSTIEVNFLIFTMQIPIIVVILVATIVGFLGGYLFAIRMRQLRRKSSNSNDQALNQNELTQERAN